jgi:hypothetical protein
MRAVPLLLVLAARIAAAQPPQEPGPDAPPPPPPPDVPVEPAPPVDPAPPPPTPAPAPAPAATNTVAVTYANGLSFKASDERYALRLQLRNQLRFESTRATEDGSQFESHFLIPRARITIDGHAFGKQNRIKVEIGLGDTGQFAFLRDLVIDKRLAAAPVWLRAGIWKRPFNRQEIVSDFASEFNERAITATFVGGGRGIGIGLHNDYERSPAGLEWALGVFNEFNGGEERPDLGTTCTQDMTSIDCTTPPPNNFPDDFAPAVVVRAGWNHGGIKGYSEGDLEGGPLRFAIGGAYKIDLGNFAKQAEESVAKNLSHGVQLDAMIKAHGLSVELGAYLMKLPASKASNRSADAQLGAFAQVGYFVMPRELQVAGRFAIAPDAKTVDRNQIEARGAVNLYWEGHAWKWASDFGVLRTTGTDPTTMMTDNLDFVFRTMLQLTI